MDEMIFTEHIRSLLADQSIHDLSGKPVDGQQVRSHLKYVICRELRRLGHWHLPPSFLGYAGASWSESDALDDLVQDAYLVCIFKRLRKLGEYLRVSGTVEGAVHWKLQRYLVDCRRGANPSRTRIFNNVKAASATLIQREQAHLVNGHLLRSATIIVAQGGTQPNSLEQLAEFLAAELNDVSFVTAISRECEASRILIENALFKKLAAGLTGYQIGHVVQLFAEASFSFQELAALNSTFVSDPNHIIADFLPDFRTISPEHRYQQSEDFTKLLGELTVHVQSTVPSPRIRERVLNMLNYLAKLIQSGEDLRSLTQAEIARRLGVPYATLNEDFLRLRKSKLMQIGSEADTES